MPPTIPICLLLKPRHILGECVSAGKVNSLWKLESLLWSLGVCGDDEWIPVQKGVAFNKKWGR